jgi:SulP family sulfate permease
MNGPFFFGVVGRLLDTFRALGRQPRTLILRMRLVPMIDASGATALAAFIDHADRSGTHVILSGLQAQPREMLARVHLGPADGRVTYAPDFASAVIASRRDAR